MDFLVLLIFYCLVFVVGCLCLLYRDASVFCTGPLGTLRSLTASVIYRVIPQSVQNSLYSVSQYLFYTRTCVFQIVFIVLCILAHTVWVIDMLPLLFQNYPHHNHTFWPLAAVFINYACYHMAWTGDPGEITKHNHGNYMKVYQHDEQLYRSSVMCSTCKLVKPARSKHCSVCDRCVHRFDHHCIWTNNCVGGLNHRFFILFMVTLILMFVQGIYVGSGCIRDYADSIRLYNASYIDEYNKVRPVTLSIAFQHLFMQLPRLVFLVVACVVLTVLVGVFLSQHLYLMFINQTTNEMHKTSDHVWQSSVADSHSVCKEEHKGDRLEKQSSHKSSPGQAAHKPETCRTKVSKGYRPYSRGILNNFVEVFFPHNFLQKRIYKDK